MNSLSQILSSRVRAEIFRVLFGLTPQTPHLHELQRRTGLSLGAVRQDIGKLVKLGLVLRSRDGNRVCFAANENHPLYPDIRALVLKTSGLADVVKHALRVKGIHAAFIFGSVARGTEGPGSDLDLMVVGDIGLRKLSSALAGAAGRIGREINPHVMTREEFVKRLAGKEHFIASVIAAPKIWILGSDDELAAMGR